MAFDEKEVEVKVRVDAELFRVVRERLEAIATRMAKIHQIDEYYSPDHRPFLAEEFPFEWLSVRRRGGKSTLNYKHFHPEGAERHTHCDEFETPVENPEALSKILEALNVRRIVTVDKERTAFEYQGKFEIALDVVKDLGFFIEVEATVDQGGIEATREAIHAFMTELGIGAAPVEYRGYPFQILAQHRN